MSLAAIGYRLSCTLNSLPRPATASYAFDGHGRTLFSNAFLENLHLHLANNLPTKALCTQTRSTFGLPRAPASTRKFFFFLLIFNLAWLIGWLPIMVNITMMLLLRLQPRRSMHKTIGAVRLSGEFIDQVVRVSYMYTAQARTRHHHVIGRRL